VVLGAQFPALLDTALESDSFGELLGAALIVAAVVVAVRFAAAFTPGIALGGAKERLGIAWSGMRGAISLAAALSVPATVSQQPQIVFVTVVVILVTLVGQGLTLPALLKALRLQGERVWSPEEAIARLETAQAALDRLDELEEEGGVPEETLRRMRELYRARFRACEAVLGGAGHDGRAEALEPRRRYAETRRDLISVERSTLVGLRDDGRLRPEVARLVQRDLDLEEARLM
jgi:hypothetical protein